MHHLLSFESTAIAALRQAAAPSAASNGKANSSTTAAVAAALAVVEKQWIAARRVFVGQNGALPSATARRADLDYQRVRYFIFRRLLQVR